MTKSMTTRMIPSRAIVRPTPTTRQDQPHKPERGFASNSPGPAKESGEVEENFERVPRKALRSKGLDDYHPPGGASRAPPSPWIGATDMLGPTPLPHHCVHPGTPWNPAMLNLLDLRVTLYYPPSMAQGLRGSVYGGSVPGSRLGSRKPSLQGDSLYLPTQGFRLFIFSTFSLVVGFHVYGIAVVQ